MRDDRSTVRFGLTLLLCSALGSLTSAHAANINITGSYGVQSGLQTNPSGVDELGMYRGTTFDANLHMDLRSSERLSFVLGLQLGASDRSVNTLGQNRLNDPDIDPPIWEPRYPPLQLSAREAFAQLYSPIGIFRVGRRGRDWGMGLIYDAGRRPFAQERSLFDGFCWELNAEEPTALRLRVGYDKIQSTGRPYPGLDATKSFVYGPNNPADDVEQYHLSILLDEQLAGPNSTPKTAGIYYAKLLSPSVSRGGLSTELNLIDLHSRIAWQRLAWEGEFVTLVGKTADPALRQLGGVLSAEDPQNLPTHVVNSLGFAARWSWIVNQSGSYFGDPRDQLGTLSSHKLLASLWWAPGSSNGYYSAAPDDTQGEQTFSSENRRNQPKISALAFHPNVRPALILFNPRGNTVADASLAGVYAPDRLVNVGLAALGYEWTNLESGTLELELFTGSLHETPPEPVARYYREHPDDRRLIGGFGSSLGVEFDVRYKLDWSRTVQLAAGVGALLPGAAFQRVAGTKPSLQIAAEAQATFLM